MTGIVMVRCTAGPEKVMDTLAVTVPTFREENALGPDDPIKTFVSTEAEVTDAELESLGLTVVRCSPVGFEFPNDVWLAVAVGFLRIE